MSSSACRCPTQSADSCACHRSRERGFGCPLSARAAAPSRRKREFTPEELKDDNYWMKRSRNNQAAKRSRERRRMEERLLEERALQLLRENETLRAALSAVDYRGVAKHTFRHAVLGCCASPELTRDSHLRSTADFQAANRVAHYALSGRCDFNPVYDSATLQRMQSFPAASFHANNTRVTDRCTGIRVRNDGHAPSSANVPYAITHSKWAQGRAHPAVHTYPHSAAFSANEDAPVYRCPAVTVPGCAAQVRTNEPKELDVGKETERVSTSPLLPHKLRYKLRLGGDFSLNPGVNS